MAIELHYLIYLDSEISLDVIKAEFDVGFANLSGIQSWSNGEPIPVPHKKELLRLGKEEPSYMFVVKYDEESIGIEEGGISRLVGLAFGNAFRNEAIRKMYLVKIDVSENVANLFGGPLLGLDKINSLTSRDELPILSVPLPIFRWDTGTRSLIEWLVTSGVDVVCESPLQAHNISGLEQLLSELGDIRAKVDRHFYYFINATVSWDLVLKYIQIIRDFRETHTYAAYTVGLRVCPLSQGLPACVHIRKHEIPIYGYNLLNIAGPTESRLGISAGALTQIFRLVGCDLINVGLIAKNIIGTHTASEILDFSRQHEANKIKSSLPMFTGTLTPRRSYSVIENHGTQLGLHIKKPLLRGGLIDSTIKRNVSAVSEAIELAREKITVNAAFSDEDARTRNWRDYEAEYGSE